MYDGPPGLPYPERLKPEEISDDLRYQGEPNGKTDAQTRYLLGKWIEKRWRHSIVASARDHSGEILEGYDNISSPDDFPFAHGQIWMLDISNEGPGAQSRSLGRCRVDLDTPTDYVEIPLDCVLTL